jgi:hypothetical protein
MKTEHADSKGSGHAPHAHPPRGVSPLRLMILLTILAVVGGALLYDWVIAPPRVKAANDKLLSEVLLYNETGLRSGASKAAAASRKADGMLYTEDIQGILGMTPTKTEETEHYTIEHYCWWGWVPRKRNFITVLYIGNAKKRHYSTHYANMMPEDNVLPGKVQAGPVVDLSSEPNTEAVALPSATPGAGAPDEGKGRPSTKVDAKASGETSKEPAKKEEPKQEGPKTEEPKKESAKDSK